MNKELEKAVEILKRDIRKPLYCGDITIVCISDLETVLKALENSIPKEVIEKKLQELDKWIDKGKYANYGMDPYELKSQRKVLQELLEKK